MKQAILPFIILLFAGFNIPETDLSDNDRKFAEKELTKSALDLSAVLDNLTTAQLHFKSSPKSWSIAECTEHIALAEKNSFAILTKAIQTKEDVNKRAQAKFSDKQVMDIMHDRKNKAHALPHLKPKNTWATPAATFAEFNKMRSANIQFIQNTKLNLRNYYRKMSFGTIDAFQLVLFASAHTDRHVMQIKNVMANKDFPKK